MHELQEAANIIYEAVDPDAIIIFGSVTDEGMEQDVRITVVATGFPEHTETEPEVEDGFSFGNSQEEVAFAPQPAVLRNSEEFYEPAIRRRNRSTGVN